MLFTHRTLIALSGLIWLAIGTFLLQLGLRFLFTPATPPSTYLIIGALFVGYLKGRFVLGKTAAKQVARISELPERVSIKYLYTKGQLLLIAGMMLLGISMRFFPISLTVRGAIDLAIGFALMNGGILFVRSAILHQKEVKR